MKKTLFLTFILMFFCSCKQQQSTTSDFTERVDTKIYLYGSAKGKNDTPLVCRFLCRGKELPEQENKKSLCSPSKAKDVVYIEESVVKNSDFSGLLTAIHNHNAVFGQIDESTATKLNSLFDNVGTLYNTSIGSPQERCSKILNSNTGGGVTKITTQKTSTNKTTDTTINPDIDSFDDTSKESTTTSATSEASYDLKQIANEIKSSLSPKCITSSLGCRITKNESENFCEFHWLVKANEPNCFLRETKLIIQKYPFNVDKATYEDYIYILEPAKKYLRYVEGNNVIIPKNGNLSNFNMDHSINYRFTTVIITPDHFVKNSTIIKYVREDAGKYITTRMYPKYHVQFATSMR